MCVGIPVAIRWDLARLGCSPAISLKSLRQPAITQMVDSFARANKRRSSCIRQVCDARVDAHEVVVKCRAHGCNLKLPGKDLQA